MQLVFNDLNTLPQQVDENARNIKTLEIYADDIDKNTADIAKNTADIAKNTADISNNTGLIGGLHSDIAQLTTWRPLSFTFEPGITGNVRFLYNDEQKLLSCTIRSISGVTSTGTIALNILNFPKPSSGAYKCAFQGSCDYANKRGSLEFNITVSSGSSYGGLQIFYNEQPLSGTVPTNTANGGAMIYVM